VKQRNKLLTALGVIALGPIVAADSAAAQDANTEYQSQCAQLAQQSAPQLEEFIRENPDDACAEFAALMLAERTRPALGARSSASFGRY
jgi:predicted negative regulator of RcsB-dependent stress response